MARSAEDCALLLTQMAGEDRRDSTSSAVSAEDYGASLDGSLKGLTLGICREFMDGLDSHVAGILEDCRKNLMDLGAEFKDVSLPNSHLAIPAYYIIAPAECSANLARYDGVRFGYRCESPENLEDLYQRSRSEGFGAEVKNRIMVGAFALSTGYYDAYYRKAQQIRRLIKQDFERAFSEVDMILGPTTPGSAFRIGEKVDDPKGLYLQDIYTAPANLAGLPALSMPAGFSESMPIGAQLIGNYFDEAKVLKVAHRYQQITDWHRQVPDIPGTAQ